MLPLLAAGLVAAYGAYKLLRDEDEPRTVNFDLVCSGLPCEQTTQTIHQALARIVRRHGTVKIGKTTNPARRFRAQDYQDFDTMYVLYEGSSDAHVGHYETHFITRFQRKVCNQHAYSTGRRPRRQKRRHFLYAVAGR